MTLVYLVQKLRIPLIIINLVACVDTAVEDSDVVGVTAGVPGISYEWPDDSSNAGTTPTVVMGGEPNTGEMLAGEMLAGEMMAGEIMAGEIMAGEMMAGNLGPVYPSYALEMLEYVNQFRQSGGRCGNQDLPSAAPLALHPLLNEASLAHAEDMAVNGYFNHQSQDGRSPGDRIAATGYRGNGFGENIAAGRDDALSTFEQWKNSPGHCVNMLRARFNEIGVGYYNQPGSQYRHYWVQKFSTR